jgi:hypothetical protein
MSNSSFFDFHCPTGGKWYCTFASKSADYLLTNLRYACASGSVSKFLGCCTTDPCTNGCVQGNIRPGGFNISHYNEFPDASCGTGSKFYSCGFGDSFWGCCKSDACGATPAATCPQGKKTPMYELHVRHKLTSYTHLR